MSSSQGNDHWETPSTLSEDATAWRFELEPAVVEGGDAWSPAKRAFSLWLSMPPAARIPRTQRELARELAVRPETLSRWKKDPQLRDSVRSLCRIMLESHLPELYGVLVREAMAGSFQHLKLAMQMAGEYTEKIESESKTEVSLSDDIKRALDKAYGNN